MAGEELYEANQQECHEADGVSENGEELEVAHALWCVTRPIGCKVLQDEKRNESVCLEWKEHDP
jgi:hypothetical protein